MWNKVATNFKKAFTAGSSKPTTDMGNSIDSIYWDEDLIGHLKELLKQPGLKKSQVEKDILEGYLENKDIIDAYHKKRGGKKRNKSTSSSEDSSSIEPQRKQQQ
jgi:hypothetical protein